MVDPTRQPELFQKVTDDDYARAFTDKCETAPFTRGVLISGDCPRCGHHMTFPVFTRVFQSAGAAPVQPDREDMIEPMLCTCENAHPGRPDGEEGCGAYWAVFVGPQQR